MTEQRDIICDISCKYDRPVEIINSNIQRDIEFTSDKIWYINNEIHIMQGCTLKIYPGTTVLFRSGEIPVKERKGKLPYSALVINTGSRIAAFNCLFKSEHENQGGGLFIMGSQKTGIYKEYTSLFSSSTRTVKSYLFSVTFKNLGHYDTGLNALTLFNAKSGEVAMSKIVIENSGYDGMEIQNGRHIIDDLTIIKANSTLINLNNLATLVVAKQLTLQENGPTGSILSLFDFSSRTNGLILDTGAKMSLLGTKIVNVNANYIVGGAFSLIDDLYAPINFTVYVQANTFIRAPN